MADLKVSHAPPPSPVRPVAKVAPKPPEPPKAPKAEPPKGDAHGPALVLGGAFAKAPVKPTAKLEASQDKPSPFPPPKSGGDGKGLHVNHVI